MKRIKLMLLSFLAVGMLALASCTKYGNCVVCQGSFLEENVEETYCDSNKNNKEFAEEFVKIFGGTCH